MARKEFHIDFIGHRKIYFTISLVCAFLALLGILFIGPKLDITFRGGTIISYTYEGELTESEVEKVASAALEQDLSAALKSSLMGESDSFDLTLTEITGITPEMEDALTTALNEHFPDQQVEMLSVTSVKPTIGQEFFQKCLVAVFIAAVLITIYVAIRFKQLSGWSAGVFAIVALLHDLFFMFGVFVVSGLYINDNFIAVMLTILGYSVNDTIVVYDRIRENTRLYGKTKELPELVNLSINQTLNRTINTTVTTVTTMLVVCIVAILTGVTSIVSFALPMVVGLLVGTYSSICISSPLWVTWRMRGKNGKPKTKKETA